MTLADQLVAIFAQLNGQSIRLMQLRRLLTPSPAEHFVRKTIYQLEADGVIERHNVPRKDGLCYKITNKSNG